MRHAGDALSGSGGFICCLLGHEQYALHASDVRNVSRAELMRADAAASDGRVGTLVHGGRAVPVHSLSALLGRAPDRSRVDRHIIVTRGAGTEPYGLLVDRMLRTPSGQRGQLLPIPRVVGARASQWFHGLLKFGDDLSCLVLRPAALDPLRELNRPGADELGPEVAAAADPRSTGASRAVPADVVATFTTDALPDIGVRRFALSAYRVAAVAQSVPSIAIPGAAEWVAGVGWWRDHAVPVLSCKQDARSGGRNGSCRSLIVRAGRRAAGGFVAFSVNADIELRRVTADAGEALLRAPVDAPFVTGVYMLGREPVALVDADRLIDGAWTSPARAVPRAGRPEPLPVVV